MPVHASLPVKPKLLRFAAYAAQLLPHQVYYLQGVQRFADPDNIAILDRVAHNSQPECSPLPYDEGIDKRKYSKLIDWIGQRLAAVDVDAQFEWIQQMERRIMTDSVRPEDEQQLLRAIRKDTQPGYNFVRFYDLVRHYRQFLCIRMRHHDHRLAHAFLQTHAAAYQHAQETYERLHAVSVDIIQQYARHDTETRQWEEWLKSVFYDEAMDGLNRYFAVVRLTFLYLNYRSLGDLLVVYDALDAMFRRGLFCTRRILLNYYANRVLLHARSGDLDQAIGYGYLSIRQQNADYLHYVNNLSALLLRRGDREEALHLMREALPYLRQTKSFHNRVGFVAFYIRCLNENAAPAQAEQYAEGFLRGYKEQVFEQRWHLFFTAYLQSLLQQEKYDKMLRVASKYRLMDKEEAYRKRNGYLPTMTWYHALAQYKEGRIGAQQLRTLIGESYRQQATDPHKGRLLDEVLRELVHHDPVALAALGA
ncbi:MAG: hypothetical protein OHK0039_47810 [Bacteroidia bacterium]